MKRLKVSDLTNIRSREYPILMYVDKEYDEAEVLHICRRVGEDGKSTEQITECNRVLRYGTPYTGTAMRTIGGYFKLCQVCGNKADFDEVLQEYHRHRDAYESKRKEEDAARREAGRIAWQEQKQAVAGFGAVLRTKGIPVFYNDEEGRLELTHMDFLYIITAERMKL